MYKIRRYTASVARERLIAIGYSPASRHWLIQGEIGHPENHMAEELRVFFGRRLDCAQCHNHPFESWSQDQFWGMTAFFGHMDLVGGREPEYHIVVDPLKLAEQLAFLEIL